MGSLGGHLITGVRPMRAHILIALCLSAEVACADPGPEEMAFLSVPGASKITRENRSFPIAGLPASLRAAVALQYWGTEDGSVPPALHGFTYDLNGDGRDEYFMCNRVYSGSGGPYYMVFAEKDATWRLIMDFQGSLHLFPARSGWPPTVSISRGGGGVWSRTYSAFQRGKYHDTLLEIYDRGTITKQKLPRE